ncbi:MAG: hypothetical protein ABIC95_04190 [archaeon]
MRKSKHPHQQYLITIGVMIALMVLAASSLPIAMALKFLTSIFAPAFSFVKAYMLCGFIALSCAVLLINWRPSPKLVRRANIKFLVMIGSVLLLGIASHIAVVSTLDLPAFSHLDVVKDGHISSSKINHIHSLKPIIHLLGSIMPGGLSDTYDHGGPFVGLVPNVIIIPAALFFVVAFLAYFLVLMAKEKMWKKEGRLYLLPLFIIVSFTVLKSLIDGGLFTYEMLLGGPILVWLTLSRKPVMRWRKTAAWTAGVLLGAMIIDAIISELIYPVDVPSKLYYFVAPGIVLMASFLAIYLIPRFTAEHKRIGLIITPIIYILILIVTIQGMSTFYEIKFLTREIPGGSNIRFVTDLPVDGLTKVYQDGTRYVYDTKLDSGYRFSDLIQRYDLNPSWYPIDIVDVDCGSEDTNQFIMKLHIIKATDSAMKGKPGPSPNEDYIWIHKITGCEEKGCDQELTLQSKGCTSSPRNMMASFLTYVGYDWFVILDTGIK